MKTFVLPFSLLLASLNAGAAPRIEAGGMYEPKAWSQRILGTVLGPKPSAHCDFPGLSGSLSQYAFETVIRCEVSCTGNSNPVEKTVTRTFNPEEQGLMAGDGHHPPAYVMPSSLGSIVSAWAGRECLDLAEKHCSDLGSIKSSRFTSLTSGDWSITETPSCTSKSLLRSPYDSRFKLAKKTLSGFLPGTNLKSVHPQPLPPGAHEEPAKCTTRISGKSCFGDCVLTENDPGGKIPLTLMTEQPYGTEDQSICADDLVKSFREKNPSPAAAEVLCREYFARRLLYIKATGTSCAAFRTDADCSQAVRALTGAK